MNQKRKQTNTGKTERKLPNKSQDNQWTILGQTQKNPWKILGQPLNIGKSLANP